MDRKNAGPADPLARGRPVRMRQGTHHGSNAPASNSTVAWRPAVLPDGRPMPPSKEDDSESVSAMSTITQRSDSSGQYSRTSDRNTWRECCIFMLWHPSPQLKRNKSKHPLYSALAITLFLLGVGFLAGVSLGVLDTDPLVVPPFEMGILRTYDRSVQMWGSTYYEELTNLQVRAEFLYNNTLLENQEAKLLRLNETDDEQLTKNEEEGYTIPYRKQILSHRNIPFPLISTWPNDDIGTDFIFRMNYTDTGSSDIFAFFLDGDFPVLYSKWKQVTDAVECQERGGYFPGFGENECVFYYYISKICFLFHRNMETGQWMTSDKYSEMPGCDIRNGWKPTTYRQYQVVNNVPPAGTEDIPPFQFTVRHEGDPFVAALMLTNGTLIFGYHNLGVLGAVAPLVIGLALMLPMIYMLIERSILYRQVQYTLLKDAPSETDSQNQGTNERRPTEQQQEDGIGARLMSLLYKPFVPERQADFTLKKKDEPWAPPNTQPADKNDVPSVPWKKAVPQPQNAKDEGEGGVESLASRFIDLISAPFAAAKKPEYVLKPKASGWKPPTKGDGDNTAPSAGGWKPPSLPPPPTAHAHAHDAKQTNIPGVNKGKEPEFESISIPPVPQERRFVPPPPLGTRSQPSMSAILVSSERTEEENASPVSVESEDSHEEAPSVPVNPLYGVESTTSYTNPAVWKRRIAPPGSSNAAQSGQTMSTRNEGVVTRIMSLFGRRDTQSQAPPSTAPFSQNPLTVRPAQPMSPISPLDSADSAVLSMTPPSDVDSSAALSPEFEVSSTYAESTGSANSYRTRFSSRSISAPQRLVVDVSPASVDDPIDAELLGDYSDDDML